MLHDLKQTLPHDVAYRCYPKFLKYTLKEFPNKDNFWWNFSDSASHFCDSIPLREGIATGSIQEHTACHWW